MVGVAALAFVVAAGGAASASAETTITVTSTAGTLGTGSGCTLRDAVVVANQASNPALTSGAEPGGSGASGDCAGHTSGSGGPYTVVLAAAQTYTLTAVDNYWFGPNGLPPISTTMTIEGNGARVARSSATGTPAFRFFYVAGGMSGIPAGSLTLQSLTLAGGLAQGGSSHFGGGGAGMGGAIFDQGKLAVQRTTMTGNVANGGASTNGSFFLGSGTGGGVGPGGGFGGSAPGAGGGPGGAGGKGSGSGGGGGGFRATDAGGSGTGSATGVGGGKGGFGGRGTGTGNGASLGDGGDGGTGQGGEPGGNFGSAGAYQVTEIPGEDRGGGGGGVGGGGGESAGMGGGGGGFGGGGGSSCSGCAIGGSGGFGGGGALAEFSEGDPGGFGGGSGCCGGGGGGAGMGGAIFSLFGVVAISDSTLSANKAIGGAGVAQAGDGLGGAVFNVDGTVTLVGSTIASNQVSMGPAPGGGGVYSLAYGNNIETGAATAAEVWMSDSIVYGDSGPGGEDDLALNRVNGKSTNTSKGVVATHAIVGATSTAGGAATSGSPITENPKLGQLRRNAAATLETMKPSAGSPALGIGSPCNATDELGNARPSTGCDLGALELTGVTAYKCTAAVGHGTYKRHGAPALRLSNGLSTSLADPQKLRVKGKVSFKLLKLEHASCEGFPGERIFRGEAAAAKGASKGYSLTFSIAEQEGGFFFEAQLTKGSEKLEEAGGPLKPTTETIS